MGNGAAKRSGSSINGSRFNLLASGGILKNPWRQMSWDEQTRFQLIETIKEYRPLNQVDASCARVLLLGQINVGKSSFFNTVNSIFRNHVTGQAPVGSPRDQRSITSKMRAYDIRNGREGKVLNFKIVDTMGIEGEKLKGFNPSELAYILDGHVPDGYQFDPSGNISPEMSGYLKLPKLQDKIHCCMLALDASKINSMNADLLGKMADIRIKITNRGIPLIVLLTKIDQACNYVANDVSLVYRSTIIRDLMALASDKIGVPVSHVLPVKNYTREIELDTYVDVLVLCAIQQMLRFADNYFDECLVHTQNGYIQPEKVSIDLWTRSATLRSAPLPNNVKQAWPNHSSSTTTTNGGNFPGASMQSGILNKSAFSSKVDDLVTENGKSEKKDDEQVPDDAVDGKNEVVDQEQDEREAEDRKVVDQDKPLKHMMNGISANGGPMVVQEAA